MLSEIDCLVQQPLRSKKLGTELKESNSKHSIRISSE